MASPYNSGKKSGITHATASMGKKANSTGAKVSASAGKSSGTNLTGDPKGAAPFGSGRKSMDRMRGDKD